MCSVRSIYDKEYIILEHICRSPESSQRDLSTYTGLSLGSVNILLKKMVKEGLLKIESIPAHRVVYMLTPKGMIEKANKTIQYVKIHYQAIEALRLKLKAHLAELSEEFQIQILNSGDEMSQTLIQAVVEGENEGLWKPGCIVVKSRVEDLHDGYVIILANEMQDELLRREKPEIKRVSIQAFL